MRTIASKENDPDNVISATRVSWVTVYQPGSEFIKPLFFILNSPVHEILTAYKYQSNENQRNFNV